MSHKMHARLLIGLPTHLLIALIVLQNALLSNGACKSAPKIGNTQVVSVADTLAHA